MPSPTELTTQLSLADIGTPLSDITFVVVDLETTGGAPTDAAITEIGAVKVRGGEIQGEFTTLVNPGIPIPPFIAALTGITDSMVVSAPRVQTAVSMFLEFAGDCVFVAHTMRPTTWAFSKVPAPNSIFRGQQTG